MQYSAMVREHGLLLLSNVVMIPTVIYIHIYKEKKKNVVPFYWVALVLSAPGVRSVEE